MTERPILFGGPQVRAILEGRKTQTRRPVTGKALDLLNDGCPHQMLIHGFSPLGQPGDRLWVRETWDEGSSGSSPIMASYDVDGCMSRDYRMHPDAPEGANSWCLLWRKRPSIHMPRWASRITLEVERVWIERLREIDEGGAVAEGFMYAGHGDDWRREDSFKLGWNTIYAPRKGLSWDANPWVWCCEFERTEE